MHPCDGRWLPSDAGPSREAEEHCATLARRLADRGDGEPHRRVSTRRRAQRDLRRPGRLDRAAARHRRRARRQRRLRPRQGARRLGRPRTSRPSSPTDGWGPIRSYTLAGLHAAPEGAGDPHNVATWIGTFRAEGFTAPGGRRGQRRQRRRLARGRLGGSQRAAHRDGDAGARHHRGRVDDDHPPQPGLRDRLEHGPAQRRGPVAQPARLRVAADRPQQPRAYLSTDQVHPTAPVTG